MIEGTKIPATDPTRTGAQHCHEASRTYQRAVARSNLTDAPATLALGSLINPRTPLPGFRRRDRDRARDEILRAIKDTDRSATSSSNPDGAGEPSLYQMAK